jgi:hypothetical protein
VSCVANGTHLLLTAAASFCPVGIMVSASLVTLHIHRVAEKPCGPSENHDSVGFVTESES